MPSYKLGEAGLPKPGGISTFGVSPSFATLYTENSPSLYVIVICGSSLTSSPLARISLIISSLTSGGKGVVFGRILSSYFGSALTPQYAASSSLGISL